MLNKLIVKFLFSILVLFNSYLFSQDWVVQLNKKYSPATTVIAVERNDGNIIFGTGFNVQENGMVVTNYHVVKEAKKIKVRFKDGDIFDVQYYTFIDRDKDFAILKIAGFMLPIVELGNSDAIEIGQEVVAIGNPKGAWHSVTKGIISQIVSRETHKQFQTDVFIDHGSSGGPLFDKNQKLIGVTTSGLENTAINFAIPINYIRGALESSDDNSRKEVGYDIKRVARNYESPSRANRKSSSYPVYKKPKDYSILLFNSSYYVGIKDKSNGWSIGTSLYTNNPSHYNHIIFNFKYKNQKYYDDLAIFNDSDIKINEVYLEAFEMDFGIQYGIKINRIISYSFGYGISLFHKGTLHATADNEIHASESISQYTQAMIDRHHGILSANFRLAKINMNLEYIQAFSKTINNDYIDVVDYKPKGINFSIGIPVNF